MNEKEYNDLLLKYKFALKTLETNLEIILEDFSYKNNYNPVEHMKSRIKSKDSVIQKLTRRNYEITTDNIINHVHDMVGVRIVCSFLSDVETIVELIKKSNELKIVKEKDYISNPKDTGYISYHLLVLVPINLDGNVEYIEAEIQIRTIAMDFWATLDHKISYKFNDEIPQEVKDEIYKCSLDIKELDKKMQNLSNIMSKYK